MAKIYLATNGSVPFINTLLYATLTDAIAAIPSTGATLFIPRGKYTGALNIIGKDNLTILGEGSSTVLHNETASDDALYIQDCDDLTITGIRVQGASGTRDGLSLKNCQRATIGDIYCLGTGRHGIRAERCFGITVDPCYCGPDTVGPYPTGVAVQQSGLVLTYDGSDVTSGCNSFQINGGWYVIGQSQSWAIQIDYADNGLINGPLAELSGGGIRANNCRQLVVNGYYGEANPSDLEYSAGTASVTSASTAVTGASTAWATNDAQGHPNAWPNKYLFVGSSFARILTAPTNTSITLAENWPGTTQAGVAYRILGMDLLLDSCRDVTVTMGRGGGVLALRSTVRSTIKAHTDALVVDADSNDNRIDVSSNGGGNGAATRIVNNGVRNRIREFDWQTNTLRLQGVEYADRLRINNPEFIVDAAIEVAAFSSGIAFSSSQGSSQHPNFEIDTNGLQHWGSGGGSAPDVQFGRSTLIGDQLSLGTGDSLSVGEATGTGNYVQFFEQSSDPAAPAANSARLFAKDNGAGKTQLVVRFPSGATQVIATEP